MSSTVKRIACIWKDFSQRSVKEKMGSINMAHISVPIENLWMQESSNELTHFQGMKPYTVGQQARTK